MPPIFRPNSTRLTKEYDELNEAEGADESGEENPAPRRDHRRMEEIEGGEKTWQPDTLAIAGAVVTIGHDGKAEIHYGYVKPEDAPKKKPKAKTVTNPEDGTVTTVEAEGFTLSAALTESLTAHRTAALGAALIDNPGVALAAVVHSLALQAFYNGHSRDTCLQITASETTLRDVQDSPPAPCGNAPTSNGALAFPAIRTISGRGALSSRRTRCSIFSPVAPPAPSTPSRPKPTAPTTNGCFMRTACRRAAARHGRMVQTHGGELLQPHRQARHSGRASGGERRDRPGMGQDEEIRTRRPRGTRTGRHRLASRSSETPGIKNPYRRTKGGGRAPPASFLFLSPSFFRWGFFFSRGGRPRPPFFFSCLG